MNRYLYRLDSIIQFILANPLIAANLRSLLTYSSVMLFIFFAGFVSVSINGYISETLSINIVESSSDLEEAGADELSEETSVTVAVKKGETLLSILKNQKLSQNEISQIVELVSKANFGVLKIGQQITFDYELKLLEDESDDLATEIRLLTNVNIVIDKLNFVDIIRDGDFFTIKNTTIPVNKFVTKSSAVINSSLMSALKSIGLSTNAIIELINAYSYQIDFQRQIQSGDTVTVITEKFMTKDGEFSHHGKILYASLTLSGKEYNIYRYKHDNVADGFFSEEGKSVKRSLLKTPVNVMRISSQYGKRLHPVDGYTKMHRGVDFSAPEGTPIYAAGDGVITELGWKSGYGRWIQIKHSATLSTAYAHSKSFAKNMKVGSKVKQGQIIAYVGRSGKTTGAHLHYEVKIDGRHVNPMSIKTTPGIELAGNTLEKFQKFKTKFQKLSAKLDQKVEIAENEMLALN